MPPEHSGWRVARGDDVARNALPKPLGNEGRSEACNHLVIVVDPDDIVAGDQVTQQLVQVRDAAERAVLEWRPERFLRDTATLTGGPSLHQLRRRDTESALVPV